jgi:cephalosporin hydroxylase
MRIETDTEKRTLTLIDGSSETELDLYSRPAFEVLSDLWVKVGWEMRYSYTFSWMGRPLIQLPEDVIRIQEAIYRIRPDIVVETGVAHGGSLIFYASLLEAMGHGEVIGVDIEIRPHNRKAIEAHEMFKRITLIEGSSTAPEIVAQVKSQIPAGAKVLVILDSDHSKKHVSEELECYHDLVSLDSYLVATDGVMSVVNDVPRGKRDWIQDNPTEAAREFASNHSEFTLEQPDWPFNESDLRENVTHWPGAWLRRTS